MSGTAAARGAGISNARNSEQMAPQKKSGRIEGSAATQRREGGWLVNDADDDELSPWSCR